MESGHPRSYIANNYKQFGFSSQTGLYDEYLDWEGTQGQGGGSAGVTVSQSNLPDYETILNNSSAGAYGPKYGMVLSMVQNMARNSTEDEITGYLLNQLEAKHQRRGDRHDPPGFESCGVMICRLISKNCGAGLRICEPDERTGTGGAEPRVKTEPRRADVGETGRPGGLPLPVYHDRHPEEAGAGEPRRRAAGLCGRGRKRASELPKRRDHRRSDRHADRKIHREEVQDPGRGVSGLEDYDRQYNELRNTYYQEENQEQQTRLGRDTTARRTYERAQQIRDDLNRVRDLETTRAAAPGPMTEAAVDQELRDIADRYGMAEEEAATLTSIRDRLTGLLDEETGVLSGPGTTSTAWRSTEHGRRRQRKPLRPGSRRRCGRGNTRSCPPSPPWRRPLFRPWISPG